MQPVSPLAWFVTVSSLALGSVIALAQDGPAGTELPLGAIDSQRPVASNDFIAEPLDTVKVRAWTIDTAKKPKPADDYVVATFTPNKFNSGAFYLKKGSPKGQAIFRSGSHYVATSLKGYGTAGTLFIYEVVDILAPGPGTKVYLAIPSDYATPTTVKDILMSQSKDDPTTMATFTWKFSDSSRGERKGDMQ